MIPSSILVVIFGLYAWIFRTMKKRSRKRAAASALNALKVVNNNGEGQVQSKVTFYEKIRSPFVTCCRRKNVADEGQREDEEMAPMAAQAGQQVTLSVNGNAAQVVPTSAADGQDDIQVVS